jgi:YhcH/YjgK/YiaL family protein
MIVDLIRNWQEYRLGKAWEMSFEFLENVNAKTADGEYPLKGKDIFARVMSYKTCSRKETKLEAHRRYVDIQFTLAGAEIIEWRPLSNLKIKTPYDKEKDVEFYQKPSTSATGLFMSPGSFAVFFPQDAHMPKLMAGNTPATIKKVVVKIKTDLLK